MIQIENEYYVVLLFIIFIVMASIFMNKVAISPSSKNNKNDGPSNQFKKTEKISIQKNIDATNQLYRKGDPETRYDEDGTRYQCISIPYRIVNNSQVEIFMITSRKRGDYMFPGGGWEKHETREQCVEREAFEEAGIRGIAHNELVSDQLYISDKGNKSRLWGYLIEVKQVLDEWPESDQGRRRKWMTINEAEIALEERRRAKFGPLWEKAVKHFIELDLYKNELVTKKQKSKTNLHCFVNIKEGDSSPNKSINDEIYLFNMTKRETVKYSSITVK